MTNLPTNDEHCAYCGAAVKAPYATRGFAITFWFCGAGHRAAFLRELGFPRKESETGYARRKVVFVESTAASTR